MARKPETKIDPLESWQALQSVIQKMDEKTALDWMGKELSGKNRRNMVMRLHSRYNKLRYRRERAELTKQTNAPNRHAS